MSIRKRPSKKSKSGYTYQVYFPYVDTFGVRQVYRKGGFLLKSDAEAFEAKKKAEMTDYGCLYLDTNMTFEETYHEYMKMSENKYASATKQYYEFTFNTLIKKSLGNRKMLSLHYSDLQSFLNKSGFTKQTALNVKKVLDITFKYAVKNGLIKENHMAYVTLEMQPSINEKPKTITKEQLDDYIEVLLEKNKYTPNSIDIDRRNKSYSIALYVGYYTGLRISEALALYKNDFDFEKDTISITKRVDYHGEHAGKPAITEVMKTFNSKAVIPLAAPLKEILQKWFVENPFELVCPDENGELIHPETMQARLRTVSARSKIKLHYHMLRHSFITAMAVNGINPEVTRDLARHSSIRTTLDVYTHVQDEQKKEAISKVFGDGNVNPNSEDNQKGDDNKNGENDMCN